MKFPWHSIRCTWLSVLAVVWIVGESGALAAEEAAQEGCSGVSVDALPAEAWVTPPANTERAQQHVFHSEVVGHPVSFHVFLPREYAENPTMRFPVLYWLHGSGQGIQGIPFMSAYYGNAMDAGKIPAMIIVFPHGHAHGMWIDSKDGAMPMETVLMTELIPHVDATFRTLASREGRLIEGFSMGGYGAGRLGLKYAGHFRAFSMMGAGPLQYPDFLANDPNLNPLRARRAIFSKVFGDDPEYYQAQSPWRLAQQREDALPDPFCIRIIIGEEDSMLQNNRALHGHFCALGIEHKYMELPGIGHSPVDTLRAIGEANWEFYRRVFLPGPSDCKKNIPLVRRVP